MVGYDNFFRVEGQEPIYQSQDITRVLQLSYPSDEASPLRSERSGEALSRQLSPQRDDATQFSLYVQNS